MSQVNEPINDQSFKHESPFPTMHVIGFIVSLILTFIALWAAQNIKGRIEFVTTVILILAILQIAVQLFFFMHITEKVLGTWHLWMLTIALFFTFAIVAGSIWIMTFGWTGAY